MKDQLVWSSIEHILHHLSDNVGNIEKKKFKIPKLNESTRVGVAEW